MSHSSERSARRRSASPRGGGSCATGSFWRSRRIRRCSRFWAPPTGRRHQYLRATEPAGSRACRCGQCHRRGQSRRRDAGHAHGGPDSGAQAARSQPTLGVTTAGHKEGNLEGAIEESASHATTGATNRPAQSAMTSRSWENVLSGSPAIRGSSPANLALARAARGKWDRLCAMRSRLLDSVPRHCRAVPLRRTPARAARGDLSE